MNRHDDSRERFNAAEGDLSEGFQAVMESIERLTPRDIADLKLQADAAELGHEAYALGLALLERREFDQARYWLQAANRYHVTGARQALEEIEILGDSKGSESVPSTAASTAGRESGAGAEKPDSDAESEPTSDRSIGGVVLPASHGSLARGVVPSAPGSIFVLALGGGISFGPGEGRQVVFGRDRATVHVALGERDPHVSRRQGTLTYRDGQWRVRNTGRGPIRIAHYLLFPGEESVPLDTGYTELLIHTPDRQHLLEVFIASHNREHPLLRDNPTRPPKQWQLTANERRVLVVLGRRYLEQHPYPQPLSWRQAADTLVELQPDAGWTPKRVEHVVIAVRTRLSRDGVPGLTREELGEPADKSLLNHNLIEALLRSTTLVPRDLALIDAA
jgi:hypothetical protein